MDRVDRGLQLVAPGWVTAGGHCLDPLPNQGVALGDEGAVPGAAVLLVEGHQFSGGGHARRSPGVSQEHQGKQSGYLAVVWEESPEQAAEVDRLVGEVDAYRVVAIAGQIALVEDEVDDPEHAGEPLADVAGRGQPVGNVCRLDLRLGTGDPSRHRGLLHQKGAGDLRDGEAAEQAQGQRHPDLHRECGVAAGEDQSEPVVLDRAGRLGRGVVVHDSGRLVLGVALRLATQPIDCLAGCGGGEPTARIGRYALTRPPLCGRCERLGRRFLGDVEVPETAREVGDHPRPLLMVGTGDRLLDGGTGHGFSGTRTDFSVRKGRTSTVPRHAFDPSAASASATSRSAASMTQKPPRHSRVSR